MFSARTKLTRMTCPASSTKAYSQIIDTGVIRLFKSYRPGLQGRRAAARDFPLREGRRRYDAPSRHASQGRGASSTSAPARPAHGSSWRTQSSPRWIASRISSSSKCRTRSALKYQYFTHRRTSANSAGPATLQPITPLNESVADYVKNYMAPGKHLGD